MCVEKFCLVVTVVCKFKFVGHVRLRAGRVAEVSLVAASSLNFSGNNFIRVMNGVANPQRLIAPGHQNLTLVRNGFAG